MPAKGARTEPLSSLALSWSGGKDSALALHWLRRHRRIQPRALITTITETFDRASMHGVRRVLIERQARALGLPLVKVMIPSACPNEVYEARMADAFSTTPLHGVREVAFGDLFLEDIRAYREQRLGQLGLEAVFPLWGTDTRKLARDFINQGLKAIIVCTDPRAVDASFAGRAYDEQLLTDLPEDVDPCGENGEFHTFVHAGPIFSEPIAYTIGETTEQDGFVFCDLLPA